jgi:hypothetical protein
LCVSSLNSVAGSPATFFLPVFQQFFDKGNSLFPEWKQTGHLDIMLHRTIFQERAGLALPFFYRNPGRTAGLLVWFSNSQTSQ